MGLTSHVSGWASMVRQRKQSVAVPTGSSPNDWSIKDVAVFLDSYGLGQFASAFEHNNVNGRTLLKLDANDLRDDLGVSSLGHRKTILNAIKEVTPAPNKPYHMPHHGKILSHLSNVRTFHSWLRMAITCVSMGVVVAKLEETKGSAGRLGGVYFVCLGFFGVLYGLIRYYWALDMIEDDAKKFVPDRIGPILLFCTVLIGVGGGFILILLF